MAQVALAFLWHQHQPYYPDDVAGENPMPWVRLHGVKDYYGMAMHLLEFPEMRCTINLVPSLIHQLQGYTDRGATDRPLLMSQRPADGLNEEDCLYLLDTCFMANAHTMIRPFPRYYDLLQRRAQGRNTAREALRRFNERDFRDLQVWFNLAWIHPIAFEKDETLRELVKKGRYFSEADKQTVLDKHLELLRKIIPLHKELVDRGQVELTTTPYYHPILPLLLDKKYAREAMPNVKLPRYAGGYPEDAAEHVRRAIEQHTAIFGRAPTGMWPAEGSVCHAMIPVVASQGIRWMATDEEILSHSLQGAVARDEQGHVRNPELLYRAYAAREGEHEVKLVFRDHALSDMIGFHYQRSKPVEAAEDFIHHLAAISHAVHSQPTALVPVILDGENCWEHYHDGGVPFLRALYERCTTQPFIRPVKIGEYLEHHPAHNIPRLFAGSWIHHNFAIWVGHEEDNTAWDALHRAREFLSSAERGTRNAEPHTSSALDRAWQELYIAEGSDWFWWYGDDHSSAQDELFDYLFRKHLQNIYILLGSTPPADLGRPFTRKGQKAFHTLPRGLLDVKLDGRETFFEWVSAGEYLCQNERGTMAMVTHGPFRGLRFGFSLRELFIRADFDRPARTVLAEFDSLRFVISEPAGWEIVVDQPATPQQTHRVLFDGQERVVTASVRIGIDRIAEIAVPFEILGVKPEQPVHFFVDLLQKNQSRDRAPREGTINLTCPSADFEQIMWDV